MFNVSRISHLPSNKFRCENLSFFNVPRMPHEVNLMINDDNCNFRVLQVPIKQGCLSWKWSRCCVWEIKLTVNLWSSCLKDVALFRVGISNLLLLRYVTIVKFIIPFHIIGFHKIFLSHYVTNYCCFLRWPNTKLLIWKLLATCSRVCTFLKATFGKPCMILFTSC